MLQFTEHIFLFVFAAFVEFTADLVGDGNGERSDATAALIHEAACFFLSDVIFTASSIEPVVRESLSDVLNVLIFASDCAITLA